MHWTATFEIITPMFLAGADQAKAELREASIKSELAFWWRATRFQDCVGNCGGDVGKALKQLHAEECALFGRSNKGIGAFVMMLGEEALTGGIPEEGKEQTLLKAGGEYLGYGLHEKQDCPKGRKNANGNPLKVTMFNRGAILDGTFIVKFRFRPIRENDPEKRKVLEEILITQKEQLSKAIQLFGLLGGLGSRKRRGFGSVHLTAFKGVTCEPIIDFNDYKQRIRNLIGKPTVSGTNFPLSAFAKETDIRVWEGGFDSWLKALNALGEEYQQYRESITQSQGANFGLPHKGFTKADRRTSPLLFHVAKIGGKYVPVATFFNNQFLDAKFHFQSGIIKSFLDANVKWTKI